MKKRRRQFYRDYIQAKQCDKVDPDEIIYIVGVNALPAENQRRIMWVGKIITFYTFERAFKDLQKDSRFQQMLNDDFSPLHVTPIKNGRIVEFS